MFRTWWPLHWCNTLLLTAYVLKKDYERNFKKSLNREIETRMCLRRNKGDLGHTVVWCARAWECGWSWGERLGGSHLAFRRSSCQSACTLLLGVTCLCFVGKETRQRRVSCLNSFQMKELYFNLRKHNTVVVIHACNIPPAKPLWEMNTLDGHTTWTSETERGFSCFWMLARRSWYLNGAHVCLCSSWLLLLYRHLACVGGRYPVCA